MEVGALSRLPPTLGTNDKTLLQEVRLKHIFQSFTVFTEGSCDSLDPYGTTTKLIDDRSQVRAVRAVETAGIDLQLVERLALA